MASDSSAAEGDVVHKVLDAKTEVKTLDGKGTTSLPKGARHSEDATVEITKKEYRNLKKHYKKHKHAFHQDCFCSGPCECSWPYYSYGQYVGRVRPNRLRRYRFITANDGSGIMIPAGAFSDSDLEFVRCVYDGDCRTNLPSFDDRRYHRDQKYYGPVEIPSVTDPTPIYESSASTDPEANPANQQGSNLATGQGTALATQGSNQNQNNDSTKNKKKSNMKCWWMPVIIAVSVTLGVVLLIWIVVAITKASTKNQITSQ